MCGEDGGGRQGQSRISNPVKGLEAESHVWMGRLFHILRRERPPHPRTTPPPSLPSSINLRIAFRVARPQPLRPSGKGITTVQIQVNTDNTIDGHQDLKVRVIEIVEHSLKRFADRITRIEVHLQDMNAHKGGRDIKCTMEARLSGLQPVAVDELAEDVIRSARGAANKLERALDTRLGRLGRRSE